MIELKLENFPEDQAKSLTAAFQNLSDELKEKLNGLIAENEQLKSVPEIMEKLADMDGMQKAFNALSIEVSKMKTRSGEKTGEKSFKDALITELESKKDAIKNGGIKLKTFLETSTDSIASGSDIPVREADPVWHREPDRAPFLLDMLPKRPSATGVVQWTERVSRTDNSTWIAEGTAPTDQSALKWKTVKADMSKIVAFMKASRESINDIPQLVGEIQSELFGQVRRNLDATLLTGTVAGDAQSMNGIDYYSQAFAPGYTLEASVTPNEYDVIAAAKKQTQGSQFSANVALVSVKKLGQMMGLRDGNGQYLQAPFAAKAGDSFVIDGVRVIANTGVADDAFYVFDAQYAPLFIRKNIELEVYDQNEDDALADLVTYKVTARAYLRVVANYVNAFVKGTFTAAKSTLTAGS